MPMLLNGLVLSALVAGSASEPSGAKAAAAPADPMQNPLLQGWTGPHGGLPPFDRVKVEHFAPALEAAMAEQLARVEAIANDPAPPTFENTLAAMERSGRTLDRVARVYSVFASTMSTPAFQAVEREMAPRLAAFDDKITQNEKLFARLAAVYEARERSGLGPEQQRLVWRYHMDFVRAGAKLDATRKKRVAEINERLATLFTTFQQNVLAEEEEGVLWLEGEAELAGLPPAVRAAAVAAAAARGGKGQGAVANTRSAVEPFLTWSTRRDLREKAWKLFKSRGDRGDARDNKGVIAEVLKLRAERAGLLGYETHAHWRVEDSMAKTPARAMELMEAVWPAAVGRVREEVRDMQAIADREAAAGGETLTIAPWDYLHYAEKVRKAKYDLDENEVKPYLQLEKLREAMFWVAGRLFDLHFSPAKGIPVYHPDVRVWEVKDGKGKHVGLWFFDPYAREGKRSGAWMNAYRSQERFEKDVTTIVSNNCNFVKGEPGAPILVSWTDAETLFHEFGHAVHGLASRVTYPTLAGTAVPRDYVEFPSQILERWLPTPEVLNRFALHVKTGKPIPKALLRKIEKAETFNQGYATVEYLSAALVDMKLHLAGATPVDPAAFEKETLAALGMPEEIALRHRLPHFNHLFAGDSYSAGYYSYLWADTISADAFEAFTEAKGPYDAAVAKRLVKHVFSAGNTVDPAEAYRTFRGKDPGIGALMRKRGFPEPAPVGVAGAASPAKSSSR